MPRTSAITRPQSSVELLWEAYAQAPQDDRTICQLVEHYLPLAVHQVERQAIRTHRSSEKADLLGAGVLGLQDAIVSFDPKRGVSFEQYARVRIHGALVDELRRLDHLTRTQRRRYRRVCRAIAELTEERQQPPTIAEIADRSGLGESAAMEALAMADRSISLDEALDARTTRGDLLADEDAEAPSDAVDRAMTRQSLRDAYRQLPERDQQLLFLRVYEELRVSEIAIVMEISEGRVSQLYREIVLKLRDLMKVNHQHATRRLS